MIEEMSGSPLPEVFLLRPLLIAGLALCAAACVYAQTVPPPPLFTDAERTDIVAFWNAPGRLAVSAAPDANLNGPWQVRLTPDGSVWLLAYTRAVAGQAKIPPSQAPTAQTPEQDVWEAWVKSKIAADQWHAKQDALRANTAALGHPPANAEDAGPAPQDPGVIPPGLLAAAGNPPPLANIVAPTLATVTWPDGESFPYKDNVITRDRYGYYRFPQGTAAYGEPVSKMSDAELDPLFAKDMTPSEARAAKEVSKFEGGFEAINTYDTGYVSVGFIQFITAKDGDGSLGEVLLDEKRQSWSSFALDFHRYGLDVTPEGVIVVVDPDTGAELTGADAVTTLIRSRRLLSVFQRAGRHSLAFRTAQVDVAKAHYWPAKDPVSVTVNGKTITGTVSDVVHSEAGLATLFDRKVNRGSIAPFADVLTQVMTEHNLTSLEQAAAYERDIIAPLKYREDFLKSPNLSQPPAPPGDAGTKSDQG
jgi:hypothetical protein